MSYKVYKSREDDSNATGWTVQFDSKNDPNTVYPDLRWRFRTRKTAAQFAQLVEDGMDTAQAIEIVHISAGGTAPDTSLHLGKTRRQWLFEQGGIQPVINQLIDEAMRAEK